MAAKTKAVKSTEPADILSADALVEYVAIQNSTPPPRGPRKSKYPFAEIPLLKGDSGTAFFFPGKEVKKFAGVVYQAQKRLGVKFMVRPGEHNGISGVKVWRIE